jgi:hypothetical protein
MNKSTPGNVGAALEALGRYVGVGAVVVGEAGRMTRDWKPLWHCNNEAQIEERDEARLFPILERFSIISPQADVRRHFT